MSRSNPTNHEKNPAVRFFEWSGSKGVIKYYDKDTKTNVEVGDKFTFIPLDECSSITGWNDPTESGIHSNEVRDTRAEPFIVKAFKSKRPLAEGFYADIKDKVKAEGGKFMTNVYIAFKDGSDELQLGGLQFTGAALGSWMEFRKENRKDLYEKAVSISGSTEGKKGSVKFKVPNFSLIDVSSKSDEEAKALDRTLQVYLTDYFKRTKVDQVEGHDRLPGEDAPPLSQREEPPDDGNGLGLIEEDDTDIPF